jgi:hypothetical protein
METIEDPGPGYTLSNERQEGLPRQHPILFAIALALLFAALPIGGFFGYLY